MVTSIDLAAAEQLVAQGAQLIDVLPASTFAETHLPGASNIPLAEFASDVVGHIDPIRPIVVYCFDFQ